ncbi:hypothetical protein ACFV2Q_33375 [Streptomyces sp. NPDC059650]|uniref:hypothetical protein n=1 Tax=Streptomyces sp. NPDC059650 TaxID=3346896 RepID=UPI0036A869AB
MAIKWGWACTPPPLAIPGGCYAPSGQRARPSSFAPSAGPPVGQTTGSGLGCAAAALSRATAILIVRPSGSARLSGSVR